MIHIQPAKAILIESVVITLGAALLCFFLIKQMSPLSMERAFFAFEKSYFEKFPRSDLHQKYAALNSTTNKNRFEEPLSLTRERPASPKKGTSIKRQFITDDLFVKFESKNERHRWEEVGTSIYEAGIGYQLSDRQTIGAVEQREIDPSAQTHFPGHSREAEDRVALKYEISF